MSTKVKISVAEFEKKVEIEAANLMHYERLSKSEADIKARKYIESKFETS